MLEQMESLGGNVQCASSRESLMYQASTFNGAVPETIGLLAETVRDPIISEMEVGQQLETAEYEIREIWNKPELILPEMVNVAGYRGNTLGNPLLCPEERLPHINKSTIERYRAAFYKPKRIVLAFAGVEHGQAVKLAERYFGDMTSQPQPNISQTVQQTPVQNALLTENSNHQTKYAKPSIGSASQQPSRLASHIPFLKNLSTSASAQASLSELQPTATGKMLPLTTHSHYTGGFLALPSIPVSPNPNLPDLSYIHLGFEALPITSKDIYALATLQTLLGGGGSFSAGGPGKGMYSRCYTNILNQHGWIESCVSFNNSYTDSAIFGLSASCQPRQSRQMLEIMCRELYNLTLENGFASLQPVEVNRAKKQLRSSLLMNLESRMVELEDLGRQVQVYGKRIGVKEMCAKIDAVSIKDLRRVARQVFGGQVRNEGKGSGAPTVVIQESASAPEGLMDWGMIQDRISKWHLGRR